MLATKWPPRRANVRGPGHTERTGATVAKATCSVEGCETPIKCKGLCSRHYQRLNIHGDPLGGGFDRVRPVSICSVAGCSGVVDGRGLCCVHYQRLMKRGDPLYEYTPTRNVCTVLGCDVFVNGRGYCPKHYQRWKTNGDPLIVQFHRCPPEQRVWRHVELALPSVFRPDLGCCWAWHSTLSDDGYGRMNVRGRWVYIHRFVYEMLVGPIPAGLDLDHLCRVKNCLRPTHMEPVTRGENQRRAIEAKALGFA